MGMIGTTSVDLFAGIPVTDYEVAQIAERGLEAVERETYENGVRKITFRDPDGNEIGLGGGPSEG